MNTLQCGQRARERKRERGIEEIGSEEGGGAQLRLRV